MAQTNRFNYLIVITLQLAVLSAQGQYIGKIAVFDSTGFQQVLFNKTEKFQFKQLYIPGALVTFGLAFNGNNYGSVKNKIVRLRNKHLPHFHTRIDDVLLASPIAAVYSLDAFGIPSKTDFRNRTFILLKGEAAALGITFILKKTVRQLRPDQSDHESFPSGHTAQAFAAAIFLSEEYRDRFRWMPYTAYGVAASVGILRMANNKHYISDVLVGAAIGLLSMKASYYTHRYRLTKKEKEATAYRKYMEGCYP
ncbi:MAG: phosphatase family protein [Sphingobacterium sp.]|jgi:membrane-associated phospholipid phosphatase|nr:phosphatase family protein [Sphingobacterium sp.]